MIKTRPNVIGQSKWALDTPCLIIDRKKLQQNLLGMQAFAKSTEKNLRPHVKTHKCSKLAKLQLQTGSTGISAAKVSEAEVLAEKGVRNILITSPVTTEIKIQRLLNILQHDPNLAVVVDNLENAQALNDFTRRRSLKLNVLVDINPGLGRTGVAFDEVIDFAKAVGEYSSLQFRGVQCYAGDLQHIVSYEERRAKSTEIMERAGDLARQLRAAGLRCEIVTGSGTGTYDIDAQLDEVTELQPGSYTMMDADYYRIESLEGDRLTRFKPALTMLSTVISTNQEEWVTIDAGLKALYVDETPPRVLDPDDVELKYSWDFGDEHGQLIKPKNRRIALNTVIELQVAHCDPTINMFDHFYITQDDAVIDVWDIDLRGCSQ